MCVVVVVVVVVVSLFLSCQAHRVTSGILHKMSFCLA